MGTIRIGIVGAGQIATLTAGEFKQHPAVDIAAVADVNEQRARELADYTGATDVYTRPEALLESAGLDAVYIAVPNLHHEPLATKALRAGKHVLLDKPFAIDLPAAERVAVCARENNRTLMLGMNQRFTHSVQSARQLVRQGRLGDVYHVKAFWRRRQGIPRMGSWFTHKSIAGGGALLDIGVHVLDVALHLLENFEPVSVSGATFTRFGNRGLGEGGWGRSEREYDKFDVDDFTTALIRLKGGQVITLEAAWAMHQPARNEQDVILYGEDGGLAVYHDRLFRAGENGEYHIVENVAVPEIEFPHCSRVHHFVNVLLGEEQLLISVEQALAVQRILDGIYRSAATRGEVKL